ncbi:TetR/AcrR family transcriptional regulator [Schleiferilactobacillus harbinensis]|uniref:TetR/AcrR family transcriptional regulator n=1 Tax=Schleiferilactobacillus harbinensis TaxID=304207 RepID=UPI0021A392EB|nr:TetR/AcrR family transcriptional regulator [Schleiferilactobacillus harbinensis]MCT2907656.1 TetR/AcrR family transcriptional regulator [Schleiferilactobacillus harbinensis]
MAGKTNDTEDRIIAATIATITKRGSAAISLRQLAQHVGLTTGAFYKHFASKDDLFRAVTVTLSQQLTAQVMPLLAAAATPKEKLCLLGEQLLQASAAQPHVIDFLFFNPQATQQYQPGTDTTDFPLLTLTRQLIAATLASSASTTPPADFFTQVWSFILGYALLIKNGAAVYDRALLARTLDQMLV